MSESGRKAKSPFRPMMIIVACFLVIPLITCGGILTWFFGRQSSAAKELSIRSAQLREQGKPVDDVSLTEMHHSRTSDRYAAEWAALTRVVDSEDFASGSKDLPIVGTGDPVPAPGEPWPQEDRVRAFLTGWESTLRELRELAITELDSPELPLRRDIKFEGLMTLLPQTQAARSFARLIHLEFKIALHDDDGRRAYECIRAMQGLRRSFDGEPFIVSQLVGIAIGGIGKDMLRQSLEADLLTEPQLKKIFENIAGFDKTVELFQLSMMGERGAALPMFTDPDKAREMIEMETGKSSPMSGMVTKLRARDGVFFLEQFDKLESLPTDNLRAFREAGQAWDADLKKQAGQASTIEKVEKALTFISLPAIGACVRAFARDTEANHLARLAIATRLYRYRFDQWPDSLDSLEKVGITAADFETAGVKPFGFQADQEGVVLWGIDRFNGDDIPDQPPVIESPDDGNAVWVWRVRAE